MKLICIDGDWTYRSVRQKGGPSEGEICTAIDQCIINGINYYQLAEYEDWFYETVAFIPLSEIDETEIVKERERELVLV